MPVPEIDVDALAAQMADGPALVDVRQPDEYEAGHVPGSLLLPLDELPDRLAELPDGAVTFICRSGGRSHKACEFLEESGRSATNVAGGTLAWIDAGHEVVQGSDPA